jgi:hypothetical protein
MTIFYRGTDSGNFIYWDSTQTTPGGVTDIIIISKNPAAGLNKEMQYNSDGNTAGVSKLLFDGTNLQATGSFSGSFIGTHSGSLTRLTDGSPYLLATGSITLSTGSSGAITVGTSDNIATTLYGSWTPSYNFSTTNSQTYGSRIGTYYKVGRMVVAQFSITLTANGVGNVRLVNLPFTSQTTLDGAGSVQVAYFQNINGGVGKVTNISGQVLSNSTTASLYHVSSVTANSSLLTDANFTATTNLVGTVTYISAN